jgi:hypothetical protein
MTAKNNVFHRLAGVTMDTYIFKGEVEPKGSFAGAVKAVQDDHDHWVTPDVRAPLGSWSLSFSG